jgi:hypothetical protein
VLEELPTVHHHTTTGTKKEGHFIRRIHARNGIASAWQYTGTYGKRGINAYSRPKNFQLKSCSYAFKRISEDGTKINSNWFSIHLRDNKGRGEGHRIL